MERYLLRLRERLWTGDGADPIRHWTRLGRYAFVLLRDLIDGQLTMRAMSLVYTTLLSIVPLLALAFSVLKALGAHNTLRPVLLEFLAPLGAQADTLASNIIGFIEKIQVGVLGSLGVALLFWSAISMIQKIESSFNFVWRVERPRPLSQRLGEYFAVLTVGPVLVFSAIGITATVMSSSLVTRFTDFAPIGFAVFVVGKLLPYVLIVGLFTFVYSFVPNTRVKITAAALGGLLAGVLWQSGSLLFASFVAGATNYSAIYSSFAILIFLLIWIYVGWMILLIGCQLAFYIQHPEHLKPQKTPTLLGGREMEYLALMIMGLTGTRFRRGEPGYSEDELSRSLAAEPEHVHRVIEQLIFQGLLIESGRKRTVLTPAVDLDSVPLTRLWQLARAGGFTLPTHKSPLSHAARAVLEQAEADFSERHRDQSLRDWLDAVQQEARKP